MYFFVHQVLKKHRQGMSWVYGCYCPAPLPRPFLGGSPLGGAEGVGEDAVHGAAQRPEVHLLRVRPVLQDLGATRLQETCREHRIVHNRAEIQFKLLWREPDLID